MSDSKKDTGTLDGRQVEVFLKTPLFRFKFVYNGKEKELLENAVRLSGKVVREKGSGLILSVKEISNMKVVEDELPFEDIFIPFSKIDFMIME